MAHGRVLRRPSGGPGVGPADRWGSSAPLRVALEPLLNPAPKPLLGDLIYSGDEGQDRVSQTQLDLSVRELAGVHIVALKSELDIANGLAESLIAIAGSVVVVDLAELSFWIPRASPQ